MATNIYPALIYVNFFGNTSQRSECLWKYYNVRNIDPLRERYPKEWSDQFLIHTRSNIDWCIALFEVKRSIGELFYIPQWVIIIQFYVFLIRMLQASYLFIGSLWWRRGDPPFPIFIPDLELLEILGCAVLEDNRNNITVY